MVSTLPSLLVVGLGILFATQGGETKPQSLVFRMLEAVEKGVNFFSSDYSSINVDGLFGLRLGQGHLQAAIRGCAEKECPPEVVDRLERLNKTLEKTGRSALPYLEDRDPAYYRRFHSTIDDAYHIAYRPHHFHYLEESRGDGNHAYREEMGDSCYARLLGTFEDGPNLIPKCNVTDACWDFMTSEGTERYFITHQLLYFILAEKMGCVEALDRTQENVRNVEDRLCRQIYVETAKEVRDGDVTSNFRDLFLEQTVLCGSLGYEDFMRPNWMRMVLNWQSSIGCFKLDDSSIDLRDIITEERKAEDQLKEAHQRRKLLRETAMKDDCLSHMSGLGFGTLCLYLRYLLLSA